MVYKSRHSFYLAQYQQSDNLLCVAQSVPSLGLSSDPAMCRTNHCLNVAVRIQSLHCFHPDEGQVMRPVGKFDSGASLNSSKEIGYRTATVNILHWEVAARSEIPLLDGPILRSTYLCVNNTTLLTQQPESLPLCSQGFAKHTHGLDDLHSLIHTLMCSNPTTVLHNLQHRLK